MRKRGRPSTVKKSPTTKKLKIAAPPAIQQRAIASAKELRDFIKAHGASVLIMDRDPEEFKNALEIILEALIAAAGKNSMAGDLIYRRTLFPLLRGLIAKGGQKIKGKGDQRDVMLLARIAYDVTKFVQEELPRKLVSKVARYEDDFPVLSSLNPRNQIDHEVYLKEIKLAAALPWRVARDSKWSSREKQKNATDVAKALITIVRGDLLVATGRAIPFDEKNWRHYEGDLHATFFNGKKLDDPWFNCLLRAKPFPTKAARRGRLKSLILARMKSMFRK